MFLHEISIHKQIMSKVQENLMLKISYKTAHQGIELATFWIQYDFSTSCHSIVQYQHSSYTPEKDDIHLTSDNLTNLERHWDVDLRLLTSMNLPWQDSVLTIGYGPNCLAC